MGPVVVKGAVVLTARAYRGESSASMPVRAEYRVGLSEPVSASNPLKGLRYSYFEGSWEKMPDFSAMEPLKRGTAVNFSVDPAKGTDMEQFGLRFEGLVDAPRDGVYTFSIESDDGGMLYIDGLLVADNDGRHWAKIESGRLGLKKGLHAVRVDFFDAGGGEALTVSWSGPGFGETTIPRDVLFHE